MRTRLAAMTPERRFDLMVRMLEILKEIADGGAKADSPEMWGRVDDIIIEAEGEDDPCQ